MAGKKRMQTGSFVAFDVFYDDGTRSSNRKVPAEILGGLDGDQPARDLLEEQERKIEQASRGKGRGARKTSRSG